MKANSKGIRNRPTAPFLKELVVGGVVSVLFCVFFPTGDKHKRPTERQQILVEPNIAATMSAMTNNPARFVRETNFHAARESLAK